MEHFTRNTVAAEAWCCRCKKRTMHRVDGVKLGPCLDCIARCEEKKTAAPMAVQGGLFHH